MNRRTDQAIRVNWVGNTEDKKGSSSRVANMEVQVTENVANMESWTTENLSNMKSRIT
jgi:hypothetical protein